MTPETFGMAISASLIYNSLLSNFEKNKKINQTEVYNTIYGEKEREKIKWNILVQFIIL